MGLARRPSRSSGAPSSCGPTTPTRTSLTAVFSRRVGGSTRPSRNSGEPSSWTRCRSRCRRTEPCSTTSRAVTTRRTAGSGRSSRRDSTDVTGQVGTGSRGRAAGASRRGDRDPGADQRRQHQPQVVARPCLRGRRERREARSVLAALRTAAAQKYVPSYWFALVHAGLGEHDQALRYLERAYEERSTVLAYLLIDPRLAPLETSLGFSPWHDGSAGSERAYLFKGMPRCRWLRSA